MQPVATVIGNCTWKKKATWSPHTFFFFLFLLTVERVKAESARAAATMLEEMQIRNQQMMEQKEKSHQEHVKQLSEKMERERAQLPKEQERTLALKLQVFNCNTVRFLLFCFPSTLPGHKCGPAVRTWSPEEGPCMLTCPFQSLFVCLNWPLQCLVTKRFYLQLCHT